MYEVYIDHDTSNGTPKRIDGVWTQRQLEPGSVPKRAYGELAFNVLLEVLALFFFCYIFFYWAGAPALFANYTCQHKWRNEVPFVYDLLAFQRDTRLKDEDEDEQLWVEGGSIEYI